MSSLNEILGANIHQQASNFHELFIKINLSFKLLGTNTAELSLDK